MSTIVHMCIDIRGIMAKPKSERRNLCRKPDGSYMTPDEAWNALADELAKGRRVLPFGEPCEGFSYETGCPGHRTAPESDDASTEKPSENDPAVRSDTTSASADRRSR